jgi:hypothetical protein
VTGVDDAELILIEVPLQLRPMGVWATQLREKVAIGRDVEVRMGALGGAG